MSVKKYLMSKIRHYDERKYWKRKFYVQDLSKKNMLLKYFYLLYIKKCDAKNCASFGTDINSGSIFASPPTLPHGLCGIFISHHAVLGKNVIIYQQVTIGNKGIKAPEIGDNVIIYPGAKVIGDIKIGNNVIVGANAVVTHDIPENAVVAGVPSKIIRYRDI